jgi:hypothetical protein
LWRSGGVAAVRVAGERAHAPRSTEYAVSDSRQSSASPLQAFGCSTPIMAFDMEKELADNDFNKVIQDVEEVIYHTNAKPGSSLSVDDAAELAKAKHSLGSNMRLLVSSPHTQPQLQNSFRLMEPRRLRSALYGLLCRTQGTLRIQALRGVADTMRAAVQRAITSLGPTQSFTAKKKNTTRTQEEG